MESLLSEIDDPGAKDDSDYSINYLKGKQLIVEGAFADAISLLEETQMELISARANHIICFNALSSKEILARAYNLNGDKERAIAEYDRLVSSDPQKRGLLLINPKNYLRLAKLYEQTGQKAKAIESIEAFKKRNKRN